MEIKRRIFIWIVLMITAAGSVKAQLYDQWASMEFKQWDFSPDSYYYSRVWRKILDLPWPIPDIYGWVPGLGYHDRGEWVPATGLYIPVIFNPYAAAAGHWDAVYSPDGYVHDRWRQQIGLRTPASAEALLYKQESNKEEDYWSKIRVLDVATIADRSGVLSGLTGAATVTSAERQEAMDAVNENLDEIKDEKVREKIMQEYHALQEKISVIDNAHMDNARKVVAMQDINREYGELKEKVNAVLLYQQFQQTNDKYMNGLNDRHRWVKEMAKELGLGNALNSIMSLVNLNKL